jgi:hypothetical protein
MYFILDLCNVSAGCFAEICRFVRQIRQNCPAILPPAAPQGQRKIRLGGGCRAYPLLPFTGFPAPRHTGQAGTSSRADISRIFCYYLYAWLSDFICRKYNDIQQKVTGKSGQF